MDMVKLVIICHYSNPEVREFMHFSQHPLFNVGRRILGLQTKKIGVGDVSPWVTYLVDYLRKRDDIELHVVSSHSALDKGDYHFVNGNVDFHFVNIGYSTMLKYILKKPAV